MAGCPAAASGSTIFLPSRFSASSRGSVSAEAAQAKATSVKSNLMMGRRLPVYGGSEGGPQRFRRAYTMAMKFLLLVAAATLAHSQQPSAAHDNYYSPARDAQVGERFITQLQAGGVTAGSEPRLDAIGNQLVAHSQQLRYRFLVLDGGKPSQDTAPNAA